MEINKPDLSRSKPFKDFGQGFYLSPGYEQAHALAKQKTDQLKNGHSSFYSTATVAIHILHTLTI